MGVRAGMFTGSSGSCGDIISYAKARVCMCVGMCECVRVCLCACGYVRLNSCVSVGLNVSVSL